MSFQEIREKVSNLKVGESDTFARDVPFTPAEVVAMANIFNSDRKDKSLVTVFVIENIVNVMVHK